MLAAVEKFGAVLVGFANEEQSQTQVFNCHKYDLYNVGKALNIDDFDNHDPQDRLLSDTILRALNAESRVTFF